VAAAFGPGYNFRGNPAHGKGQSNPSPGSPPVVRPLGLPAAATDTRQWARTVPVHGYRRRKSASSVTSGNRTNGPVRLPGVLPQSPPASAGASGGLKHLQSRYCPAAQQVTHTQQVPRIELYGPLSHEARQGLTLGCCVRFVWRRAGLTAALYGKPFGDLRTGQPAGFEVLAAHVTVQVP